MSRRIQGVFVTALVLAPAVSRAQAPSGKPPTALTATAATRSAVTLSWTPADPAQMRFLVERKPLGASWSLPSAPPMATMQVEGPTYTDQTVDPYTTYVYRIRGLGPSVVVSGPSNEITVGGQGDEHAHEPRSRARAHGATPEPGLCLRPLPGDPRRRDGAALSRDAARANAKPAATPITVAAAAIRGCRKASV